MGQKESLNTSLHRYVYNRDAEGLAECCRIHESEITSSSLDDNIYVSLIERQWDSDTIYRFAKLADDHQRAVLIAAAVLHGHVVPLAPLFDGMRDRERTIDEHHLRHLFLVACERENIDAVRAFVANGCYDTSDTRPLRAVVRAQLSRSVVFEELLRTVLEAYSLRGDEVRRIRTEYLRDAKSDAVREIVDAYLAKYLA